MAVFLLLLLKQKEVGDYYISRKYTAMIDTIPQVIHDTVFVNTADAINILDSTKSYYESSFNTLLWVIGAGFTLVGVIVPFIIQYYQRDRFNNLKKELYSDMELQFRAALKEEKRKLRKQFTKLTSRSMAGVFFLQATASYSEKNYLRAFEDYYSALKDFYVARDSINARSCITNMNELLVLLGKNKVTEIENIFDVNFSKKILELNKKYELDIYHEIYDFRRIYSEVMNQPELPLDNPPAENHEGNNN